jgi:hypothetical protein
MKIEISHKRHAEVSKLLDGVNNVDMWPGEIEEIIAERDNYKQKQLEIQEILQNVADEHPAFAGFNSVEMIDMIADEILEFRVIIDKTAIVCASPVGTNMYYKEKLNLMLDYLHSAMEHEKVPEECPENQDPIDHHIRKLEKEIKQLIEENTDLEITVKTIMKVNVDEKYRQ